MPLRIVSSLLFLLMTVFGATVQPESLHRCMDPTKNVGNITQPPCTMDGHFRNSFNECQKCTVKGPNGLTVERECSPYHDAVFKCGDGKYVKTDPSGVQCNASCDECQVCGISLQIHNNFEKQACQGYSNTVCCHADTDIVIDNNCVDPLKTTTPKVEGLASVCDVSTCHATYILPYKKLIGLMMLCLVLVGV